MNEVEVTIIAPCYNENVTVVSFLKSLEDVLGDLPQQFLVVIVNDASTDDTLDRLKAFSFTRLNLALKILDLKFNVGHQGAIYQGLLYARDREQCDRFIVMDSDGEDDPMAIRELVTITGHHVVNVVRGSRQEGLGFRTSYRLYRLIFRAITGFTMNFGNYAMISRKALLISVHTSFIHFAAHLSKLKLSKTAITFNRKQRIDGKSKMNLLSLIHHAFKSMVEYAEELVTVFLKLFLLIGVGFLVLIFFVLYKKLFTEEAVLGWASTLSATLFNMLLICLGFFVIGILLMNLMSKRSNVQLGIYEEVS